MNIISAKEAFEASKQNEELKNIVSEEDLNNCVNGIMLGIKQSIDYGYYQCSVNGIFNTLAKHESIIIYFQNLGYGVSYNETLKTLFISWKIKDKSKSRNILDYFINLLNI